MRQIIIFFAIIVAIFFAFRFQEIMFLRPQSVHQWRQTDSASYAYNYFLNDAPFLLPEVMTLLGENGRVISEFPILYYIAGQLYKIFGFQEWILRILTFSTFVFGLFSLFKLGKRFFREKNYAFVAPLMLLASPMLSYYALNFLPNVPGLSLSFIAWYFFFSFLEKRDFRNFLYCSIAATFATLLKPVEIFNFLIMLFILFLENWNLLGLIKKQYEKSLLVKILLTSILVFLINFAWIKYAQYYADTYGYHGNLLGILPITTMTSSEVSETIRLFKVKWLYQIYHPMIFVFLAAINIFNLLFFKRIQRNIALIWLLITLSQIVYALLFFQVFYHHDYYWINSFVWVVFSLFCFIQIIESFDFSWLKIPVSIFFFALIVFGLKHSRHIIYERYFGVLREESRTGLMNISPYLRSIGIQANDRVVSVPDFSPNISLYLMGQKGWSEAGTRESFNIKHFIAQGAKYLIVNAEITREKDWYTPYLHTQIGEYQGVKIYKLP
jgi:hypothetical protein